MEDSRPVSLSCDNCRRRKVKCIKRGPNMCHRCQRLSKECITSGDKHTRPYYYTSKERFDLMARVVQHFVPGASLETEDLRALLACLEQRDTSSNCTPWSGGRGSEKTNQSVPQTHGTGSDSTPRGEATGSVPMESASQTSVAVSKDDGAFLCDAMDNHRYESGISCAAFNKKVYKLLAEKPWSAAHAANIRRMGGIYDGRIIEAPSADLPDRDHLERASVRFFKEVNSILYIMSEDQFHQHLDDVYLDGRPCSYAFMAVVYFVMAVGEGSVGAFRKGSALLHQVFAEGTATSVQAVILAVLYKQSQNERNLAWVLLGAGIRISQSLGLHLSNKRSPRDSFHQSQSKRRLWCSIYELEQVLACSLGRPSGIVGIAMPEPPEPALGAYASEHTPPGYCAATAAFARVLHNIRARIYTDSEEQAPSEQTIGDLIREVDGWWSRVPAHLKSADTMPPSQARAVCCLELRYHYALMLLTRPHLLYSTANMRSRDGWPPEIPERVRVCEQASSRSVAVLLEMARRDALSDSVWFDADYIICTGVVLFLRGLRESSSSSSSSPPPLSDGVLALARDFMPLLETTRNSSLGNHAFETLDALLNDAEFQAFGLVPPDASTPGIADVSALFHADVNLTEMLFELN